MMRRWMEESQDLYFLSFFFFFFLLLNFCRWSPDSRTLHMPVLGDTTITYCGSFWVIHMRCSRDSMQCCSVTQRQQMSTAQAVFQSIRIALK
ncbi:hypothetical protein I7I50_04799 [Histoplasma capsulatum G186AR]|uniref:Uncharacterized protein n=1 Tax=Ajellomyces capsulatus TaxID=5037 RepID=A0A8H7Y8Y5_AJECA|nr:hypothetical protein I7I52_12701 [Histoplasma capsulatum]QSS75612.1 hypothetical protein I7I50_04799 [Histoplasma capsulatum G186AR]